MSELTAKELKDIWESNPILIHLQKVGDMHIEGLRLKMKYANYKKGERRIKMKKGIKS